MPFSGFYFHRDEEIVGFKLICELDETFGIGEERADEMLEDTKDLVDGQPVYGFKFSTDAQCVFVIYLASDWRDPSTMDIIECVKGKFFCVNWRVGFAYIGNSPIVVRMEDNTWQETEYANITPEEAEEEINAEFGIVPKNDDA